MAACQSVGTRESSSRDCGFKYDVAHELSAHFTVELCNPLEKHYILQMYIHNDFYS